MDEIIALIFGFISLLAMFVSNIFFNRNNKEHIVFLSGAFSVLTAILSVVATIFLNGFELERKLLMISDDNCAMALFVILFLIIIIASPVFGFITLGAKTKKEYFLASAGFYFSIVFHLNLI
jgi:hypothetical protein